MITLKITLSETGSQIRCDLWVQKTGQISPQLASYGAYWMQTLEKIAEEQQKKLGGLRIQYDLSKPNQNT